MTKCPAGAQEFAGFDLHSEHHRLGAEDVWSRMRELPMLPRSDKYGGFYVVTRHADLRKVAAQHAIYSSAAGVAMPTESRTRHIPEEVDPPLQREYRKLLDPFLSPDAVAQMAPTVRAHAVELLDSFADQRRIDFVAAFSEPFPVRTSLALFGFPRSDAARLFELVSGIISHRGTDAGARDSGLLTDYLVKFLAAREVSASGPADDIIAAIALGSVNGQRLTLDDKVSMTRLLLFGGFTTVNLALSSTLHKLALNPQIGARLRSEPDLFSTAVEEFVRLASPGTYLRRVVTTDTELGGTALHPGDQVLLCFGAANLDPATFDRPDDVVIDRNPNPHVGFGFGTHRCMGSMLAKLEIRIVLEELLARYERFELDPERPLEWGSGETQGLTSLPLILHRREN